MTYPHCETDPETGLPLLAARDGELPELPATPFHWIQPNVG
jgi:hypothetical protein